MAVQYVTYTIEADGVLVLNRKELVVLARSNKLLQIIVKCNKQHIKMEGKQ